jgi:outer membrane receptor for monomeric catechols
VSPNSESETKVEGGLASFGPRLGPEWRKRKASHSNMNRPTRITGCLSMLCAACVEAGAQEPEHQVAQKTDLASMKIEDLMNVRVTSVSKKEQSLFQAAAAIFVITQEDIRRSGAISIPDLLRMVPGLNVSQINANSWAVSSRGFNTQFVNKMLVLIDGRAVDTQLTWRVAERVELNLVGQNLLHDHHVESLDALTLVNSSLVKRSAYAKMTWRF